MFTPADIECISFDAAGTLIRPSPSVGAIYAEMLRAHGVHADAAQIENNFRCAFKQIQSQAGTLLNKPTWKSIVARTLQPWTCDNFNALFESLWQTFALPERWTILPAVLPLLEQLQAMQYRMIVLSNNDARLVSVLNGLGLAKYFQAIYISAEIGYEKPDIRIFQHVTQTLNTRPDNMLHVGDSFKHDHTGALRAGWHSYCLGIEPHSLTDLREQLQ